MTMLDLFQLLSSNSYPGRGIVLGRSADNKKAVIAYFIMGRSENSRNRVFEATEDGIRTRAYDESKMTDPSLIIYHPVRVVDGTTIVTNGDQTDTIANAYRRGEGFVRALRTREFEPDCPNYTPRISGAVRPDGSYRLSILKSAGGDPACCQRFFFEYDAPIAGQAHFISTYQGDGSPLPSFEGEPRTVALDAPDANTLAARLWESLNAENKVSLFVSYLDLETGKADSVIVNKHQ
ncbi:IMP cyclohydrolase [uncultured Pseudoflavonifractor sp.]|uniref:IMP cyclohydrolase n=1 Tax=uncultured Pseudoflavonifractor sp. TaxID=1221379 RepID=UPI0025F867A2|nr:IMP cyclohydrolase [uncultured Pseudoflavonifractor sp.]